MQSLRTQTQVQPGVMAMGNLAQHNFAGKRKQKEDKDVLVIDGLPLSVDWSLGTTATVGIQTLEEVTEESIYNQYKKEWQQRVRPDLRTLLVRRLIEAMSAASNDSDAKGAGTYAQKLEREFFDVANDRSEYYQLMAEKTDMIQKEQDEKRLELEAQQKSVEEQCQEPEAQDQRPQLEAQQQPQLKVQQQPQLEAQQHRQPCPAVAKPSLIVFLITISLGILFEYALAPLLY